MHDTGFEWFVTVRDMHCILRHADPWHTNLWLDHHEHTLFSTECNVYTKNAMYIAMWWCVPPTCSQLNMLCRVWRLCSLTAFVLMASDTGLRFILSSERLSSR